jgi:hypothetical protein
MSLPAPRQYAQNILQFHAELRAAGASADEHASVASAHRLASEIFAGQTRGSGKPFIEHLVGTASILAAFDARLPVVAAGLLHAAYDAGDFGLGLTRRHPHRKAELTRAIGAEAEGLVERYHALRWNPATIGDLASRATTLADRERPIVFIRLANELEEHLDCGIQFCANRDERLQRMQALGPHFISLALAIGQPALAGELQRVFAENRAEGIPPEIRGRTGHSFLQRPRSYRRRWPSAVRWHMSRAMWSLERRFHGASRPR